MKKTIWFVIIFCLFSVACTAKPDTSAVNATINEKEIEEQEIIILRNPPPEEDQQEEELIEDGGEIVEDPVVMEEAAIAKSETVLAFAGDVLLDVRMKSIINEGGYDAIFAPDLTDYFFDADMAMVNMEFPFSRRGTPEEDKQYTFRADPDDVQFLLNLGIDAVSLGNNHVIDYGRDALLDTFEVLEESKITYAGAGRNYDEALKTKILEINGKKIGIVCPSRVIPFVSWYAGKNLSGVLSTYDPQPIYDEIKRAREEVDYLIVYVHWGVERATTLEKYQINMAHGYIDSGADIVIGSHPHILQGFEFYKGKPIAYSLGNFIFTDSKKDTAILMVTITDEGTSDVSVVPCRITKRRTSKIEDGEILNDFRKNLNDISINAFLDESFRLKLNGKSDI